MHTNKSKPFTIPIIFMTRSSCFHFPLLEGGGGDQVIAPALHGLTQLIILP